MKKACLNNLSQQKNDFLRDGFVLVREFLSDSQLSEIKSETERYKKNVVPRLAEKEAFYEGDRRIENLKQLQRMEQHDDWFMNFATQSKWVNFAENLLSNKVVLNGVEWFNKPPKSGKATPPHQDGYYFCLKPDEAVTLWIAVDRVDETNGCLRYSKKSHLKGIRRHGQSSILGFSQSILDFGDQDLANEEIARLEPGDMVAHHSRTIHWADNNQSSRSRESIALVFFSKCAQRDPEAYARYQRSFELQQRQISKNNISLDD